MTGPPHYEEARRAVAEMLAKECGETVNTHHYNEATKILWPHLAEGTRTALVLR